MSQCPTCGHKKPDPAIATERNAAVWEKAKALGISYTQARMRIRIDAAKARQ